MKSTPNTTPRFNPEADETLMRLYGSVGATTPQEKINALKLSLEGEANFYAFAGEATPEMLVGCLEYEFLSRSGLIELLQA